MDNVIFVAFENSYGYNYTQVKTAYKLWLQ